jgi:acylphosphatase
VRQVHLEIRGHVQGVGFRWFVRETGRALGLSGWVKNRADGAVEVAAAGPDDAVDAFVRTVREGPRGARVDDATSLPVDHLGELEHPFAVHRE